MTRPDILVIGGNASANRLALKLAETGFRIVVAVATDIADSLPDHPGIRVRRGPLDREGMAALLREEGIAALVNAAHPYAESARATAPLAAGDAGVLYFSYLRPESPPPEDVEVHVCRDHAEAAEKAFSFGMTVLSTVGVRNLGVYVAEAMRRGIKLAARVLPEKASLDRCRELGLADADVIAERGPFTTGATLWHIRRTGAGTLATKDGGAEGGMAEKYAAAREGGCRVVLVRRPEEPGRHYRDVDDLVETLSGLFPERLG